MDPNPTELDKSRPTWIRWCLRWLVRGILGLVVLIILFYIEEDLRGAYAWSKAKAELKAKGISLDPQTYIPPPVSEAENFGALPIFKLEPDPKQKEMLKPLGVERTFGDLNKHIPYDKEEALKAGQLPFLGRSNRGEKLDLEKAQKQLVELCRAASPLIQVHDDANPSDMLTLLYPFLFELRTANATHPLCRFEHDYLNESAMVMSVRLSISQILVAKVLAYEEKLALYDNRSQLALDDMSVDWKIIAGLQKEPICISGLIAAGVVSIQLDVVREGLDQHVWNDQQLVNLDMGLSKMDFLREIQLCLQGDFVTSAIPFVERVKAGRLSSFREWLKIAHLISGDQPLDWHVYLPMFLHFYTSDGGWDQGLAYHAQSAVLASVRMVDPATRRVFPDKGAEPLETNSQARGAFNCIKQFAYAQAKLDEARIACRLERYRLAHGLYPATLDMLVPAYGAELPRDIVSGEPYRYKLSEDGTYVLYSVGWNQKDDGGQVSANGSYNYPDYPDWIWTNRVAVPKK